MYLTANIEFFAPPDQCLRNYKEKLPKGCIIEEDRSKNHKLFTTSFLQKLDALGIKFVDWKKYFCRNKKCYMVYSNKLFYRDDNHLNEVGAKYLGSKLLMDYPNLNSE